MTALGAGTSGGVARAGGRAGPRRPRGREPSTGASRSTSSTGCGSTSPEPSRRSPDGSSGGRSLASVMGGELVALPDIGYGAALGRGGRWTADDRAARRGPGDGRVIADPGRGRGAAIRPGGAPAAWAWTWPPSSPGCERRIGLRGRRLADDPVRRRSRAGQGPGGDAPRLRAARAGAARTCASRSSATAHSARPSSGRSSGSGSSGRVRFPRPGGALDDAGRYRAATLLAVTSRHEGQSMVAVEAAACGLPVVGHAGRRPARSRATRR